MPNHFSRRENDKPIIFKLNNKIFFMIVCKCVCYLKRQNTTYL